MWERQYRYLSAPLIFLVVEHGACVESVWDFILMAAIHEPVELSKGDMGIDAYTLLETFLRFSLSDNSYKLGNGAKRLDYVFYLYIQSVTGGTDQTSGGCSLC